MNINTDMNRRHTSLKFLDSLSEEFTGHQVLSFFSWIWVQIHREILKKKKNKQKKTYRTQSVLHPL